MGQHLSLDLSKAHLTRQHGDLLAVYTWVNDERALVLLPAYRRNSAWFVVCESAAYRYDDPSYLARQARKASEVLGIESSTTAWLKIASIIHEGLPDLVRMPSAPAGEYASSAFGEAKVRINGEESGGLEAKVERVGGATYG